MYGDFDIAETLSNTVSPALHSFVVIFSSLWFFRHHFIQSTDIRTRMISGPLAPRSDTLLQKADSLVVLVNVREVKGLYHSLVL